MFKYNFVSEASFVKPGYFLAFETKNGIGRQAKRSKIRHTHPRTSVIKYDFASEASSAKPGYVLAMETKKKKHPKSG